MPPQRPSLSQHLPPSPETIDPRWMVKALLATIALAAVCAYLLICGLFSYGQWQLVLQPSRTVVGNPASVGLQFEEVHFFPDTSGKPQLDGWWIPGDTPGEPTALLLHDGRGSIGDALPAARWLHDARLDVLLFDYRGFGRSLGAHPSEKAMEADSDAALAWLRTVQHVTPSQTIVFGDRLGASLAVRLCGAHPDLGGLVLQQGDGDFASRAALDTRSKIVPFRMLFHEDFPLADPLHSLKTPKLLLSFTPGNYPVDVGRAADPKMTVEIAQESDAAAVHTALRRFLDTYFMSPPPQILPAR